MKVGATGRRDVVLWGAAAGLGLLSEGCGAHGGARTAQDEKKPEEEGEVTPAEDLMREHGVLNRLLLVYEECARRIDAGKAGPIVDVLGSAADLLRRFIEDYHEKLEEDFLFPRFEKAHQLVGLVGTLRRQHQAGRRLTEQIRSLASIAVAEQAMTSSLAAILPVKGRLSSLSMVAEDAGAQRMLLSAIHAFVRMYRPHEAREDTVLFPALHAILSPKELAALGERFEDKEHELFGERGFEGVVEQVAQLEQRLGIEDLDQFTPPLALP
jgi:hemerythrin-like domain-containing protein